ncbi:Protein arginine N-methyltransferase 5 [Perkinsus chesapeaki]|uniref:Protein arginine N-methyltransferase 5 n=1 Tax=Perkinsus chesapeaki TaxID=330153 RepID=A0A7J6N590_PERCH|nr:Protein arginine N-methyltransferase 5 [Perkinsus chesapeaki]
MPLTHSNGAVPPLYLGRWFDGDGQVLPQSAVSVAGSQGFDYISLPLKLADFEVVNGILSVEAKICQSSIVGRVTSVDDLKPQLSWARYLSTYGICLPTLDRETDLVNYAAVLKREVLSASTPSQQWQEVPSDMWEEWSTLRGLLNHPSSVTIALTLSQDIGSCAERWLGEPVRVVIVSSDLLTGAGTIGTPAHQMLLMQLIRRKAQVLLKPASDDLVLPLKAAVDGLYHRMPPPSSYDRYCEPYYDILQQPLQPLKDNLDNTTYATFEEDFTKYLLYEHAVGEFLADRGPVERDAKLSIAVVGAGRGGLVEAALRAIAKSSVLHPGDIIFYAVEKNEDAVRTLKARAQKRDEWKAHAVKVVCSDLRDWSPSDGPLDVVISEFLGSFGDNEASPELLTDAFLRRILKPNGVCIPQRYTSFCQPIMCPALWTDIRCLLADTTSTLGAGGLANSDRRLSTPFVVVSNRLFYPSPSVGPQEVFTFDHTLKEKGGSSPAGTVVYSDPNDRFKSLSFPIEADAVIHGLQGYFECILFDTVMMSINPKTHTTDMVSWFPILLPLSTPITVRRGQVFTWNIWRRVDQSSRRMWYEWCVTSPVVTPIQNTNGNHYYVGLVDVLSVIIRPWQTTWPPQWLHALRLSSNQAGPAAAVTPAEAQNNYVANRRRVSSFNSMRGPRGVCWAYQSSGRCVKGDSCNFQHIPGGDINTSFPPQQHQQHRHNYNASGSAAAAGGGGGYEGGARGNGMGSKTILCRSVSEGRVCNVSGCRFGHSIGEVMQAVEFCKNRECVFHARGFCRKGDTCPYTHTNNRRPRAESGSQWQQQQPDQRDLGGAYGPSLLKTPPIAPQHQQQLHAPQYQKSGSKGHWKANGKGGSNGPPHHNHGEVSAAATYEGRSGISNLSGDTPRETVFTISAEATGGDRAHDTSDGGKRSCGNSPSLEASDTTESMSPSALAHLASQPSTAASSICAGAPPLCYPTSPRSYADYCRALQLREALYPNATVEKLRRASRSSSSLWEDDEDVSQTTHLSTPRTSSSSSQYGTIDVCSSSGFSSVSTSIFDEPLAACVRTSQEISVEYAKRIDVLYAEMTDLYGRMRQLKERNRVLERKATWLASDEKLRIAGEVATAVSSSLVEHACPRCLLDEQRMQEINQTLQKTIPRACQDACQTGSSVSSLAASLAAACRDAVECNDQVCEGLTKVLEERDSLRELTRSLRNEVRKCRADVSHADPWGRFKSFEEGLESSVGYGRLGQEALSQLKLFPSTSTQEDIFAEVAPVIEALSSNIQAHLATAVGGLSAPLRRTRGCTNLCVFAYGQTGKTHTLEGGQHPNEQGLLPRSLELLFAEIGRLNSSQKPSFGGRKLSVALCVVEVYNENVRDLLSEGSLDNNKLEVKLVPRRSWPQQARAADSDTSPIALSSPGDTTNGNGCRGGSLLETGLFGDTVYLPGVTVHTAATLESAHQLLSKARASRAVGQNRLNPRSSRSHLVVTAAVVAAPQRIVGRLWFVDLAGSERLKTSGEWVAASGGSPLKRASTAGNLDPSSGGGKSESSYINQSLTSLGNVLSGLRESSDCEDDAGPQPYIPYRGSKLTFLLQDALGGRSSKVLMFSTLSSNLSDQSETLSTLNFAGRAATSVRSSRTKKSPATSKCSTTPGLNDSTMSAWSTPNSAKKPTTPRSATAKPPSSVKKKKHFNLYKQLLGP